VTASCDAKPSSVATRVTASSVGAPTGSTTATTETALEVTTTGALEPASVVTSTSRAPGSPTTTLAPRPAATRPPTTAARQPAASASTSPPTTKVPGSVRGLAAVAGRVIAIDPGHNGDNWQHTTEINRMIWIGTQFKACDTAGTATAGGYSESAHNLDVALRLRSVLAAAGAQVVMSRTTDAGWGPCIDERAHFANRARAAVAISIHADGGPVGGRGYDANVPARIPGYTDGIYAASHRLGVDIGRAFGAGTGMPPSTYFGSGGLVERSDFGGLNLSDVPKILFETGNMKNPTDAALISDPSFRQREAEALAVGLAAFLAGE